MTRIQANLLLLLAGAMWGMGFVAQSSAMGSVGPFLFIGLRFALATLVVLPFAIWEGRRAKQKLSMRNRLAFVWVGLMMLGAIVFQQIGLLSTTVTNSGFLTGLYVVMTPLFAVILFRNWPHPIVWPAALTAFAGIWFLSGGAIERLTVGDWLTVLAAAFCAMQVIFIARAASSTGRPITLAVTQFAISAVTGLTIALIHEPIDLAAIRIAAPEIVYAGIFSGGIAFTLQVIGQRYTTAPQAAIFLSSEALFAALFGALILGERLPASGFLGCSLIFAAILGVEVLPALLLRDRASETA
ncbi:drug/metabolite transporter (DMT)-like permease [Mesorhizobium soli]|uniref:DMT family transporter n=1 Tax=Pseudaminobacter soli (ex Li et al. 2025) TaxID=1295366 RepID=UPI00247661EA|nr:DMT family transporter [Mesorhizobium soli]MDH6234340.1 drug/metabolite transporter (DMT)-like permease [Mesorhizobium soli]